MSDKANDRQVGGDHYKKFDYEPWDFFIDAAIPSVVDFAIKYIIRWRDKNGVADLEKAKHCLEKCEERDILIIDGYFKFWHHFTMQLSTVERVILFSIEKGNYRYAITEIEKLIETQKEQNQ